MIFFDTVNFVHIFYNKLAIFTPYLVNFSTSSSNYAQNAVQNFVVFYN